MSHPSLLLVEDDVLFATWATAELRAHCEDLTVHVAHDLTSARNWLHGSSSGTLKLAVIDLHLGKDNGTELIVELTQCRPKVPILVLTAVESPEKALRAIRAGAQGYMLKVTIEGELCRVVNQIRDGGSPINPTIAYSVLSEFRATHLKAARETSEPEGEPYDVLAALSARESEVLRLVARGYSDKEVAMRLDIAPSTVDTHVRAIYRKLRVNSRSQLRRALEG